jgi:hypothetical protein
MRSPISPHPFRPRLIEAIRDYSRPRFFADLGAGLTVGIVALPLAGRLLRAGDRARCRSTRLVLCALNEQPLSLLRQAGFDAVIGDAKLQPDLAGALAPRPTAT